MKLPAEEIKTIAVFRALQLGDLLCAIPAMRALRRAYPEAHITLLGLPWAASFTQRFHHYFNDFIWFPGFPGLPEQQQDPFRTASFLQQVVNKHFDLVLQMQGNGSIVNPLVEAFGGKYTAGFYIPEHYYPDNGLFTLYPSRLHEIERHLALMEHLGLPLHGTQLEFPVTPEDEEELKACQFPIKKGEYVCVHPGSRGSWRQWPAVFFAALADHCAAQGLQVIVTGTADEAGLVEQVVKRMKHPAINAAGKTSLGAVAVLIRDAFALVSNCTGVSHIAAAFQTKSIVISMDGEPHRWGPLNTALHRTIDWVRYPDFHIVLEETAGLFTKRENAAAGGIE